MSADNTQNKNEDVVKKLEKFISGRDRFIRFRILDSVGILPESSITNIAKDIGKSRSWVSIHTNDLARKGLLYMQNNPSDSREKLVNLTFPYQLINRLKVSKEWRKKERIVLRNNLDSPVYLNTINQLMDSYKDLFDNSDIREPIIMLTNRQAETYKTLLSNIENNLEDATKKTEVYWIVPEYIAEYYVNPIIQNTRKLKNLLLFCADNTLSYSLNQIELAVRKKKEVLISNLISGGNIGIRINNSENSLDYYNFLKNILLMGYSSGVIYPNKYTKLPKRFSYLEELISTKKYKNWQKKSRDAIRSASMIFDHMK